MVNVTSVPYILSDERSFINGTALRLVFTVDGGRIFEFRRGKHF